MKTSWKVAAVLLLTGLVAAGPGRAQSDESAEEAVRKLYSGFFDSLRQGGAGGALANLRQTGALDARSARALEPRLQAVETAFGRPDGHALVGEMEIPRAPRYRSAVFLTFHEPGPVAWRLRFYQRITGVWVISSVQVETEFVDDFTRLAEVEFAAYRAVLDRVPTRSELRQMLMDAAERSRR